ncbi:MAG: metal ABC transporter permease [Planctomycetes bacterium]|nr:metal ABC transporter permease [Planctomycetota bacterium]
MMRFFDNSTLVLVSLGTALLGFVSGALGSFAVLRRQSLLGDALSHAALPGIAIAFLFFGKAPILFIVGAALAGWVATLVVSRIVRHSRVPFDSALGGSLAVFFGFGLVLMTYIRKNNINHASEVGLERYLYGQAATMLEADVRAIAIMGGISLLILMLFWKEMKLLSFDPEYGASLGYPMRLLDLLLTGLLVIAIVIGLQSVGVVLMSALIVAPAAAARQWSNRLGIMVLLAACFGAASGIMGTVLSDELSGPGRIVPTGPTIVLCAIGFVILSFGWRLLRSRPSGNVSLEGRAT